MYRQIVSLLKCPVCGEELLLEVLKCEGEEIVEGRLVCAGGHKYIIHDGVADFGSTEQADSNSWSQYYEEVSYDELDREIENRKSDAKKQEETVFKNKIIEKTNELTSGFLIDIASGRGMLLKELMQKVNKDVHIIATDLSFAVLKYDRIKFKELTKDIKVSYVACDATKLPFKDDSADMLVTFVGYVNMMTIIEKGIEEASRILKPGSKLIDSCVYIKEDSEGFEKVKKTFAEYDMPGMEMICSQSKLLDMHRQYFRNVNDEIAVEGIGEQVEGDLFPIEGEWYGNAVIIAQK